MEYDLPFQDVTSQWDDTRGFPKKVATPVSWVFIETYFFIKVTTKWLNPAQGKAPSCAAKSRSCPWQWYQNHGTKEILFMASSPARRTCKQWCCELVNVKQTFYESRSTSLTSANNF